MLKRQLSRQEVLDLRTYILEFSGSIQCKKEKELILKIILQKTPRKVVCIHFESDAKILADYQNVSNAVIKLTTICNELKFHDFKDPMSIHLRNHMMYTLDVLKTGLDAYGYKEKCEDTPTPTLTEDKIKNIATQVFDLIKTIDAC